MTHIIIGQNTNEVNKYLLNIISKILKKEITDTFIHNSPDIHILKSENINSIGIEDVKEFQKEMVFKPFLETHQIGIVFNAEKLTFDAQNSFLKTLEEQPETTVYILISNKEKSLLDTILSRGIKHILNSEKDITESDVEISEDLIEMFNKIEEISQTDLNNILEFLEKLLKNYQSILRTSIKNGENSKDILEKIETVNRAYERISANGNKRLVLENMVVALRD